MTTSDWITLAGALGSILAASLAAYALWKIGDERRRTFNLGLLVELSKALVANQGLPDVPRSQLLLRIVPIRYMPVLRAHFGQGVEDLNRRMYQAKFGVSAPGAPWPAVLDAASVELAEAAAELLSGSRS